MKTSKILERAKNYLWDGVESYENDKSFSVCGAIVLAVNYLPNADKIRAAQVRIKIMRAIGETLYVSRWLQDKHKVPKQYLKQSKLMQEYRHRWLDHMIATYKEAGK
jgi:hypothetical protein